MQLRRLKLKGAPAVPLTEEDRDILTTIYESRRRLFVLTMLGILFIANVYVKPLPPDFLYTRRLATIDNREWLLAKIWLHLIIAVPSAFIFRRRIWTYRKDILRGEKLVLYERIGYKQYFPITGQYFLGLEDADYMHHEVDAETYQRVREGDLYPVYFAPYSHYAFNMRGAFSAM